MYKCKRDLNNNNLKSTYYYKYLIRLLSKTIRFNSVNLQFAPRLWTIAKSRQVTGLETKGDNNVKKVYSLTLKAPNKNCSRRHFNFLLLSFEENKAWFFMWILFTWNNKSYFLWKTMKKYLWMSSAAVVIGSLRVNIFINRTRNGVLTKAILKQWN